MPRIGGCPGERYARPEAQTPDEEGEETGLKKITPAEFYDIKGNVTAKLRTGNCKGEGVLSRSIKRPLP